MHRVHIGNNIKSSLRGCIGFWRGIFLSRTNDNILKTVQPALSEKNVYKFQTGQTATLILGQTATLYRSNANIRSNQRIKVKREHYRWVGASYRTLSGLAMHPHAAQNKRAGPVLSPLDTSGPSLHFVSLLNLYLFISICIFPFLLSFSLFAVNSFRSP